MGLVPVALSLKVERKLPMLFTEESSKAIVSSPSSDSLNRHGLMLSSLW